MNRTGGKLRSARGNRMKKRVFMVIMQAGEKSIVGLREVCRDLKNRRARSRSRVRKRARGRLKGLPLLLVLLVMQTGCGGVSSIISETRGEVTGDRHAARGAAESSAQQRTRERRSSGSPVLDKLSDAAIERTAHTVRYDPTYFVIPYPNGDVPADVGVCTDEVIRSYRAIGIDLQREVHEDMARNFSLYPRQWKLTKPDTNIDHRRVPNLMLFFARRGAALPISARSADYLPGDTVTWDLGGGLTHIGIVVGVASAADPSRLMIVHNIGAGPQMEDVLFRWKITGHYRYTGQRGRE